MVEEKEFERAVTSVEPNETVEKRKVQKNGRVDIPNDWLEHMGVNIGDSVFLLYDDDSNTVEMAEVDGDTIRESLEK